MTCVKFIRKCSSPILGEVRAQSNSTLLVAWISCTYGFCLLTSSIVMIDSFHGHLLNVVGHWGNKCVCKLTPNIPKWSLLSPLHIHYQVPLNTTMRDNPTFKRKKLWAANQVTKRAFQDLASLWCSSPTVCQCLKNTFVTALSFTLIPAFFRLLYN